METPKTKTSDDYKNAVKAHYEEIKNDIYSGLLLNPTPALLKQLCILKFEACGKTDREIFNRFFAFRSEENKLKQIENFDTDRFRPLCNFLKGKTKSIQHLSLEVIAILTDLEIRPLNVFLRSDYEKKNTPQEPEKSEPEPKPQLSPHPDTDVIINNYLASKDNLDIEHKTTISLSLKSKKFRHQIKMILLATIYFAFISFLMSYINYTQDEEKEKKKEYTMRIDCRFKAVDNDKTIKNIERGEFLTSVNQAYSKTPQMKIDTSPFMTEIGSYENWYMDSINIDRTNIDTSVLNPDTINTLEFAKQIIENHILHKRGLPTPNKNYQIVDLEVEIGVSLVKK